MKRDKTISTKEYLALLEAAYEAAGSNYSELARQWGVTYQSIQNARNGANLPGPAIQKHLGIKQVKEVRYRYVKIKKRESK